MSSTWIPKIPWNSPLRCYRHKHDRSNLDWHHPMVLNSFASFSAHCLGAFSNPQIFFRILEICWGVMLNISFASSGGSPKISRWYSVSSPLRKAVLMSPILKLQLWCEETANNKFLPTVDRVGLSLGIFNKSGSCLALGRFHVSIPIFFVFPR